MGQGDGEPPGLRVRDRFYLTLVFFCIHSMPYRYFLSTRSVPGTVLDIIRQGSEQNNKIPVLMNLLSSGCTYAVLLKL